MEVEGILATPRSSCISSLHERIYAIQQALLVFFLWGLFPLNQVFGILKPPPSVLRRFCKILSSELWRQVRRIQDHLRVLCYVLDPGWVAESKLRAITRLMANMIEVTWAQILHQELRMAAMKRCAPPPPPKNVTTVGDVLVPEDVANLLNKGPKFPLEPDVKGQEWLSLNRQIARKAPEEKHEKCLLDGVDALMKAGGTATTRSGKDPLGKGNGGRHGVRMVGKVERMTGNVGKNWEAASTIVEMLGSSGQATRVV
ncbi:hypothetical protein HPB50_012304 [Hyalomma asiaticum]|uniref:Uncharacterized protein n=1 Tax=Hyalomma asiaticum TaxID=266040 RepID=A0ACB7RX06_HYAAI|nr:hypothetical protein HPB50_012304 [Hyalomma asiaticum]